jgi:hypothetical protein
MFTRQDLRARFDSTYRIDPELPQRQLAEFAGRTGDAARRGLIENFRQHMYQEMIGLDIDELMGTMVAEPQLHFYGIGPAASDLGYREVRHHYEKSFDARRAGISFDIEYLAVDDDGLAMHGEAVFGADFARQSFGVTIDVPAGAILVKRMAVLVPCTDGKIAYEAQYIDGTPSDRDVRTLAAPPDRP